MKILLLQDVKNVGKKGEIKNIADGFALNSILPKKYGVIATPELVKKHELEIKQQEANEKIQKELAEQTFKDLTSKPVLIKANASDKGHLFASIHIGEILVALKEQYHIALNAGWVEFKQPIKEVGEYRLKLKAYGVSGELIVEVK